MNILKKMLKSSGSSGELELYSLPSGQLYLARSPSSPKSENECLYSDVFATIIETSIPYHYQLKITKDQTNQEEIDDEDEDDNEEDEGLKELSSNNDEWTFLIDESLKFCLFQNREGKHVITWKDPHGDIGDMFEFRVDSSVSNDDVERFMNYIYKCEYERKFRKSSNDATIKDLSQFVLDRKSSFPEQSLYLGNSKAVSSLERGEISSEAESDTENVKYEDADDGSSQKSTSQEEFIEKISKGKVLYENKSVSLYLHNPIKGQNLLQDKECTVTVIELGDWDYALSVKDSLTGKSLIVSYILQDMSAQFNPESYMFLFNCYSSSNFYTWAVGFKNDNELFEFQKVFTVSLWESVSKIKYVSAAQADQDYLSNAFDAMKISEDDDINEVLSDDEAGERADYPSSSSEEESDSEEEQSKKKSISSRKRVSKYKKHEPLFVDSDDSSDDENTVSKRNYFQSREYNRGLNVGYKTDRTFVARGNRLGVFKNDEDGLELYSTIENIKSSKDKKKLINPNKMMLHQEDRVMILQDEDDPNKLYKMDLEVGKVVEDWDMTNKEGTKLDVVQFGPTKKYNQLTNDQLFNGLSSQGIFKIDPRLQNNSKIVDSDVKTYKTKTNFSSLTTTADGYIAVGSSTGDIRLYDKIGSNAKTQLPSLGDGIIGLDVSSDGRYVLATCKTYLLLLDTKIHDGKNVDSLGFVKYFDKDKKPIPRRLQLLPQHIAFIQQETGKGIDFTVAHFDTELGSKVPTSIVSATGPYAIKWSMKKILKGSNEPYMIRRYGDTVNADNFRFNNRNEIIVSLADDVKIFNKKSLKRANPKTLRSKKGK